MENLSRIAQGIFLGNGEVWNFLDYAVNRNCGGLMVYTQKNNFLGGKLNNNFNGGFNARYKYNDIHTTKGYAIDRVWGGLRGAPRGFGGNIGDLYKVPDEFNASNSDINFITKEEYTEFQKEIRQKNISKRDNEAILVINTVKQPYKEISTESYAGQFEDKWKNVGLKEVGLGDEINLWGEDDVKHSKYSLEEFADSAWSKQDLINIDIQDKRGVFIHNEDTYRYFSVSSDHPIHYHNITAKVSERTFERLKRIEEVAKEKQNTVKHYQSASQRFIDLASKNVVLRDNVTFNGLLFEYTTEGTEKPSIPTIENYGLYAYYSKEREKYVSTNISEYPGVYGIVSPNEQIRFYNINEENDFQGEVSISPDFKGGGHSVYNVSEGTRSYSFYEEAEKGAAPTELKTNVSDGSSVSLTDYRNTSRLLRKTNQLFNEAKIGSLINRFHTDIKDINNELTTAYDKNFGISRGRNLLRKQYEGKQGGDTRTGYDDPYCRVWTAHHQYSTLKDRIRPFVDGNGEPLSISSIQSNYGDLRTPEGKTNLDSYSVLRKDGFLRITPTHDKGEYTNSKDKIRNYMFSIENLAWRDITPDINSTALSTEQRGPNGGRIMWFPPYNLKFSENVNVNWNANSFIGRGEEIYTYTNTVRSGTLDFTLLIDHPSILNKWRGTGAMDNKEERERDLLRFFAGCGNINDEVLPKQSDKEEQGQSQEDMSKTNPSPVFHSEKIAYIIFFPNDFSGKDYVNKNNIDEVIGKLSKYNTGGDISERDKAFEDEISQLHNLVSTGFTPSGYSAIIKQVFFAGYEDITAENINYFSDLLSVKTKFNGDTIFGYPSRNCKINNIEIKGFASSHGYVNNNLELCNRRRTIIKKLLESQSSELSEDNVTYTELEGSIIQVNNIDGRADVNSINAKLARAAYAIIDITWKEDNVTYEGPIESDTINVYGYIPDKSLLKTGDLLNKNMVSNVQTIEYNEKEYTYDNEYMYFSEIIDDKLVYKNIVDKVKYFDPAFHSITPEGFNARLTFLHQCTRQGPTNAVSSGRVKGRVTDEGGHVIEEGSPDYLKFAGNLAFGRAPYCILRIGDFFNTKICIDSMSITYDNNGTQWDLNPEGVGVQPMYANISISFKFLGGQDITKPIERLQNAVTSNYYANASIYSRHADNNNFYYDAFEDKRKEK